MSEEFFILNRMKSPEQDSAWIENLTNVISNTIQAAASTLTKKLPLQFAIGVAGSQTQGYIAKIVTIEVGYVDDDLTQIQVNDQVYPATMLGDAVLATALSTSFVWLLGVPAASIAAIAAVGVASDNLYSIFIKPITSDTILALDGQVTLRLFDASGELLATSVYRDGIAPFSELEAIKTLIGHAKEYGLPLVGATVAVGPRVADSEYEMVRPSLFTQIAASLDMSLEEFLNQQFSGGALPIPGDRTNNRFYENRPLGSPHVISPKAPALHELLSIPVKLGAETQIFEVGSVFTQNDHEWGEEQSTPFYRRLGLGGPGGGALSPVGDGYNLLVGSSSGDTITAGDNGDVIVGGNGDDSLRGGDGNDSIDGGEGDDTISGGKGDDTIYISTGSDIIDGGEGKDTIDFSGQSSPIVARITGDWIYSGSLPPFSDGSLPGVPSKSLPISRIPVSGKNDISIFGTNSEISNIENIKGSSGDDRFQFDHYVNNIKIDGGEGNDTYEMYFPNSLTVDKSMIRSGLYITDGDGNVSLEFLGFFISIFTPEVDLTPVSNIQTLTWVRSGPSSGSLSNFGDVVWEFDINHSTGNNGTLPPPYPQPWRLPDGSYARNPDFSIATILVQDGPEVFDSDDQSIYVVLNNTSHSLNIYYGFSQFEDTVGYPSYLGSIQGVAGNVQISPDSNLLHITYTPLSPDPIPCFVRGTLLETPSGPRPVEHLRAGDLICVMEGGRLSAKSIKWAGWRHIDCSSHPRPQTVWPVRIASHAFGPGLPHSDLWLSRDHAVFVDNVLIPIRYLINGITIVQKPVDLVAYYHIELEQHVVLLAEGLPCESYLDTGNRGNFANGGRVATLFPDFSPPGANVAELWEAYGCAPLVVCGPLLDAERARLNARAQTMNRNIAAA